MDIKLSDKETNLSGILSFSDNDYVFEEDNISIFKYTGDIPKSLVIQNLKGDKNNIEFSDKDICIQRIKNICNIFSTKGFCATLNRNLNFVDNVYRIPILTKEDFIYNIFDIDSYRTFITICQEFGIKEDNDSRFKELMDILDKDLENMSDNFLDISKLSVPVFQKLAHSYIQEKIDEYNNSFSKRITVNKSDKISYLNNYFDLYKKDLVLYVFSEVDENIKTKITQIKCNYDIKKCYVIRLI